MITTNTLGQEIKNPEKFWKWFDNSILVDDQGRPLVFYHGTRNDFTEFKSNYSDQLIFFSYEKEFADDWGKSKKEYDTEISNEISDLVYEYKNKLFKEYQAKYGEEFYMETEPPNNKPYNEYRQKVDKYEQKLEQERNVHNRTLGCYLKAHKLFIPEKDYELVLDEIFKYYDWENPYTNEYEAKLNSLKAAYDSAEAYWDKWWSENKNADEETIKSEEQKLKVAYREYLDFKRIRDRRDYDLNRIKAGAWVYFEHGVIIDKIYELGYDAIQLSEREGKQTTIAVRPNQIKSVDNNGNWSNSNNIYEDLQDLVKVIQRAES